MLVMWLLLGLAQARSTPPRRQGFAHLLLRALLVGSAVLAAFLATNQNWWQQWSPLAAHVRATVAEVSPEPARPAQVTAPPAAAAVPAPAVPAAAPEPLLADEIFGRQDPLMRRALADLAPGSRQAPHLYFVAFAADGGQDVFYKEAVYSRQLFEQSFGTRHRSLILVNNRAAVQDLPLATVGNLRQALAAIGSRMNREQDILFLFLDSHGSEDGTLSVRLDPLNFSPLTAAGLADMLKDAGIRWKVILVSGCYSGSFVPALNDGHTLIMTAARADRTSFGCSNTADFTYFGRAYFAQALQQTRSFAQAFGAARDQVGQWEARDQLVASEPQMVDSPALEAQLERWRHTLPKGKL